MTDNLVKNLLACQYCDSVFNLPEIEPGQKAMCKCCGTTLFTRKKDPLDRTIATALAGLLVFIPACILPIFGIGVAGQYNEASLVDCILLLIDDDFYIIAFCLFMFTIAIPLVRMITALYISLCLKFNFIKPSLLAFFRSYHLLDSWAMIQVFFLGIIISIYKLYTLETMEVGGGLLSLLLVLVFSTLVSVTMDQQSIWQKLERTLE